MTAEAVMTAAAVPSRGRLIASLAQALETGGLATRAPVVARIAAIATMVAHTGLTSLGAMSATTTATMAVPRPCVVPVSAASMVSVLSASY
jgi:hypothetical protein